MNQASGVAIDHKLTVEERRAFLKLPVTERQRLMTLQAAAIADVYERAVETEDRLAWQGGDIVDHAHP